jgi:hypothetical protein
MRYFFKLPAVLGLIFPWFFKKQLNEALYWIVAFGYLSLLISTTLPPRARYWWWTLFEHLAFFAGGSLISIPIFFPINRMLGFILVGLGLFIVMFFGYSARMRLIGQPDPSLDLFLELKDKFQARNLLRKWNR